MKHFFLKPLMMVLTIGFFLTSCSSDDDNGLSPEMPEGAYDLGYIIANEGNFGSPNASVSFINADLTQVTNSIFQTENPSETLGDVLHSISFDDEYAYLIMNNSNKVVVVDRFNFQHITTLTENINLPRFAEIEDGKLYIGNSQSKDIAIYNISDFSYGASVSIDKPIEYLKAEDGFLYVQNAAFGQGNEISVIDLSTNQITKTLTVGGVLNSMTDDNGILYALHSEGITKINMSTATEMETLPFVGDISDASKLTIEDEMLFFIAGSKIYGYDLNVTELNDEALFDTQVEDETWFLGYGFAVENGKIFYSDVNGFTEDSSLRVYDFSGKLLNTLTTGIGSNSIYFND
ncbi:MAG: hypothetical protein L0J45_00170 [Psychroflexus sp.]|nr:hypothetical protein [Psychroflexus sp.]MDN6309293.1 hypothetical protein [Psychroflexus sp.]